MKRLALFIIFLITLQIFSVAAYEVGVNSFSKSEVILEVTGLQSLDIKVTEVKATVESETISDTYTADVKLQTEGDKVLIIVDISPIFEDYTTDRVKSITVSGVIEVDGEKMDFGKRVPFRDQKSRQLAPSDEQSSNLVYWIIGLCLVLVCIILALFYRKPKEKILSIQKVSSKVKRKTKKKRVTKKAKTKKKAKKRL